MNPQIGVARTARTILRSSDFGRRFHVQHDGVPLLRYAELAGVRFAKAQAKADVAKNRAATPEEKWNATQLYSHADRIRAKQGEIMSALSKALSRNAVTDQEQLKTELKRVINECMRNGMIHTSMEMLTLIDPKDALDYLSAKAHEGGPASDCAFVALEMLAIKDNGALRSQVLRVMDDILSNGASPQVKEIAAETKREVSRMEPEPPFPVASWNILAETLML